MQVTSFQISRRHLRRLQIARKAPGALTDGFSLVEVMCAIVILGVGLLGLVEGLTTALASHKESEWQTTAAFLAAGQLESLRADGFVIAGEDSGTFDGLPLYQWRQSIAAKKPEGLFEVTITIEHSQTGRALYELRTLLFDPPTLPDGLEPTSDKNKNLRQRLGGAR